MITRAKGAGGRALPCLLALFMIPGCTVKMGQSHGQNPATCRSEIGAAILDQLKNRKASTEDILIALGEPDDSSHDRLEYRWVVVRGTLHPNPLGGGHVEPFEWQTNSILIMLGAGAKFADWKLAEGPWMPWTENR